MSSCLAVCHNALAVWRVFAVMRQPSKHVVRMRNTPGARVSAQLNKSTLPKIAAKSEMMRER